MGDQIWIQSVAAERSNTWYRLLRPAPEYERFYRPFLWLANFAKYFTDYLSSSRQEVSLSHFRVRFHREILRLHGHDPSFQAWRRQYGVTDFRRVVAAHPEFLYKEAVDVERLNEHQPIWSEVCPGALAAVEEQVLQETSTVVTPFVYDCFKDLAWGKFLKVMSPSSTAVVPASQSAPWSSRKQRPDIVRRRPKTVVVGDVVAVEKDTETAWKSTEDLWFAYVQGVKTNARGEQSLAVIWLYAASDTTCANMRYPFPNELFFSDNCNCGDARLDLKDVVCGVSVEFFGDPATTDANFVVRQKYRTDDAAFVTLRRSDFTCFHLSGGLRSSIDEAMQKYRVGDTVLYLDNASGEEDRLEPAEIVAFQPPVMMGGVLVRRLLRRKRDFSDQADTRPNELVYTDGILTISAESITRKCHVRFYSEAAKKAGKIPPPYCRDGTADAFYIICRQVAGAHARKLEELTPPFPGSLRQGFDPIALPPRPVLRGMDLFCGGGNFGRGLEEGGAVRNEWAVDCNTEAVHTYRANLKDPAQTAVFYGSVNDFLAQAITGRHSRYVPRPGQVDFISAGSPCQGFSNVNQSRSSDKSLRHSSLVASVAAFIDVYRPKYAVLENVVSMAHSKDSQQNVFSQLLCALVGMEYQVQQFYLDAWSCGSSQKRSRLFVSIAAPGFEPLALPVLSHAHPPATTDGSLGVASNGVRFGMRRFEATPFQYLTAAEGTSDLPWLGDGRTNICVPHPDHRTSRTEGHASRVNCTQVPIHPRGECLRTAFERGRVGQRRDDRRKVKEHSKAWQRVRPNGVLPTITTQALPRCAFTGTIVHWDQHRVLTIMEARRAQSFPDHEVLVGRTAAQWKLVGNSVARSVALALGMSLREAWLGNEPSVRAEEAWASASVTGDVEVHEVVEHTVKCTDGVITRRRRRTGRVKPDVVIILNR